VINLAFERKRGINYKGDKDIAWFGLCKGYIIGDKDLTWFGLCKAYIHLYMFSLNNNNNNNNNERMLYSSFPFYTTSQRFSHMQV